jgi:pseudaminic acid cytidylyltransferase
VNNIAIIPARGGSRRILRKNVRMFHGKPMIGYAIELAKSSMLFDRVIVSTDSEEIEAVAREYGASTIVRPAHLAVNEVGTQDVMQHAVSKLQAAPEDLLCCIYPTVPLLTADILSRGLRALQDANKLYAFGVCDEPHFGPAGAFYWGRAFAFEVNYPLISERSLIIPIPPGQCCDINTEDDWQRAEAMYAAIYPERVAA